MTDELDDWIQQIFSSDNRSFSNTIEQGLHFIAELQQTGKLIPPFTDRTNAFMRNSVPNIINKGMNICGNRSVQEEGPFYNFILNLIQFSINSLYSNESYFFILYHMFNIDPNLAGKCTEYINFVNENFLSITNRFEAVLPAFRSIDSTNKNPCQNILIDYSVFYFLLKFQSNDEDFVKQTFGITVPSFFGLLRRIDSKMLRNVQLFFLLTLYKSFFQLFYHDKMKGTEFFPFYSFLREAIRCEVLDKQLYGCHMFRQIFNSSNNDNFKGVMLQWFFDSDIFSELVHNQPHIEVLRTMSPLFEEMASKQLLRFEIFEEIWRQSLSAQTADLITYYQIIVPCIPYFEDQYVNSFFENNVQKLAKNRIENMILFYKIFITTLINTPFSNFSFAVLGIVENTIFDFPDLRGLVKELIVWQNPVILNKINEMVLGFISKKIFHEIIYDVTIFLFVNTNKEYILRFDGKLFFDYIATGVIADVDNSGRILEMLSECLMYFHFKMPLDFMVKLYTSTKNDIFWNFLYHFSEKNNMELFEDINGFCQFVKASNENFPLANQSFVFFFKSYYFYFSLNVDQSIVKDNNGIWLVKTNEHLHFLFILFCLLNNENLALNIQEFFLSLICQSQMEIQELVQFFIVNSFEYIYIDNSNHKERVLKFILCFIDSIEGRFDFSVLNKISRLHNSKKLIKIETPILVKGNSGERILIRIMPNSSDFALKNVISAVAQIPLNSILVTHQNNGETIINITNERNDFGNIVVNFNHFPSVLLSNHQIFDPLILKLRIEEHCSSIIYKLLNRLLFIDLECDINPQHYLDAFSVVNNNKPFYFLYMTQRLKHLIQNRMGHLNLPFLNDCFPHLLNAVLNKLYEPYYLKGALDILATYYDQKLPSEPINILIECSIGQRTTNVKHSLCYLRVARKLLPDEGIIISFNTLTKLVKIIDSDEMNDHIINIISSVNIPDLLLQLISLMVEKPNSFINIHKYVKEIAGAILNKYPDIQIIIFNEIFTSCKNISNKPIIVICGILRAFLSVGQFDLSDIIPHLLIDISFHTIDQEIQSAVFELLNDIDDEVTKDLIGAILVSHLSSKFSSYDFDPNQFSRIHNSVCGLTNLGCTCYINSVLQQVCSVDEVIQGLSISMNELPLSADNEELLKLFSYMRFGHCVQCSTSNYCKAYHNLHSSFDPRQQEDASEYFHTLLSGFPQSTKSLFEGKLKDVFQTEQNSNASNNNIVLAEHEDIFTTISVSISNINDLVSSLREFVSPEKLSGNNKYKLESGEKVDALRFTKFVSLPRFLVFQLKRFEYNLVSFERYKVDSMFSFPTTLNMDEFTENGGLYRIKGVVLHIGDAEGGHYVSVVKKKNGKWYNCDDTNITEVEEDCFLKSAFGSGHCSAYLLFFEKDDSSKNCDINGERIFNTLPEALKNNIIGKNNLILERCSLLTQASFDFFKNKVPFNISILYFFNVLCHSSETRYTTELSKILDGCSSFVKEDVSNFLTILKDSVYISTYKAISKLAGKDLDIECIQLILAQSSMLLQNENLFMRVGLILVNVAKSSVFGEELMNIIYSFLVNHILPSNNYNSLDSTNYFEALSFLIPNLDFDVKDILQYLKKIEKNTMNYISFIRFLQKANMEYDNMEYLFRSGSFNAIANYLPIAYLTIDNNINNEKNQQIMIQIKRNELDAKSIIHVMIDLCMKKSEILLNALRTNPCIVHIFLLHQIKEVRDLSEKLVIAVFSNFHKQQSRYENSIPYNVNSKKIKIFVDYMIHEIPKFVDEMNHDHYGDYEDSNENNNKNSNSKSRNNRNNSNKNANNNWRNNNYIYYSFFRTLGWFMSNVSFNNCSDIFDPLLNLLAKLKESKRVFDLDVLEITKFLRLFNSPPFLLNCAFDAFFANRSTLKCELFPKSLEIFLQQIEFNINRNIRNIDPLLNSDSFFRLCKFINSQNYHENHVFEKFSVIIRSISSNDQHYNERFGAFFV